MSQASPPSEQATFDALHLFIDESGDIANPEQYRGPLLVGGVAVLGDYTRADSAALYRILKAAVDQVRLPFPEALHHRVQQTPPVLWRQMIGAATGGLASWPTPTAEALGVSVVHRQDFIPAEVAELAERHRDNRYVRMLLTLVEHLVFLDDLVGGRLAPGAEVHVHVAQRSTPVPFDDELRRRLMRQGYDVVVEDVPGDVQEGTDPQRQMKVLRTLDRRELLAYLLGIWARWRGTEIRIGEVTVKPINYTPTSSTDPAMWLADLYLHQIKRNKTQPPRGAAGYLLPVGAAASYGPWAELLAKLKSSATAEAAEKGDVEAPRAAYVAFADLKDVPPDALLVAEQALTDFARGLRAIEFAARLAREGGADSVRARALEFQGRLSAANHRGDVATADRVFAEYEAFEPALESLHVEGLRLRTEIRNRRAVSLMDRLQFQKAAGALAALIGTRQQFLSLFAAVQAQARGGADIHVLDRELGACFGTLGQARACSAGSAAASPGGGDNPAQAEQAFRSALQHFADPADRMRQWVYLGHVACDRGAQRGRPLWDEVTTQVPELAAGNPPLWAAGEQYTLALQVKGVLVFGSDADRAAYLQRWPRDPDRLPVDPEVRREHPFGLIYQDVAELYADHARRTGEPQWADAAAKWFDNAAATLSTGGTTMQVLAQAAKLRKFLAVGTGSSTAGGPGPGTLETASREMRRLLIRHFGNEVWSEPSGGASAGWVSRLDPGSGKPWEDRARAVLTAFRFNYW